MPPYKESSCECDKKCADHELQKERVRSHEGSIEELYGQIRECSESLGDAIGTLKDRIYLIDKTFQERTEARNVQLTHVEGTVKSVATSIKILYTLIFLMLAASLAGYKLALNVAASSSKELHEHVEKATEKSSKFQLHVETDNNRDSNLTERLNKLEDRINGSR